VDLVSGDGRRLFQSEDVQKALGEWANVFRQLPRVDAVSCPAATRVTPTPTCCFPFSKKQTANLHRYHPHAQIWVSPQSFNQAWLDSFVVYLKTKQPAWLSGVVYGPQIRISLPALRGRGPQEISHPALPRHHPLASVPIPGDRLGYAYAVTEGREVINPRPVDEAQIFRALEHEAIGFISYSEGCNDDVNKIVWSGLAWTRPGPWSTRCASTAAISSAMRLPTTSRRACCRWSRTGGAARRQPGRDDDACAVSGARAQGDSAVSLNWRFQQALYRAYTTPTFIAG